MLNHEALTAVVCSIVEYVTGITTVPADKNVRYPEGTYAAVRLSGEEGFGQAMKSGIRHTDTFTDQTRTQKILQFSINIYRDGANQYAGALREANKREPVRMILHKYRLGWNRLGPVQNLTALQNAAYEERAQVYLYLNTEDMVEDTVNRILRVKYSVAEETGDTLIEDTVNGLPR